MKEKIIKNVELFLRFILRCKKISKPIQPPIVTDEIKLEQLNIEKRALFEEIEVHKIPVNEAIDETKRGIARELAEFIYQNNLGHVRVSKDEINQCYKVVSKLYIGINQELNERILKDPQVT